MLNLFLKPILGVTGPSTEMIDTRVTDGSTIVVLMIDVETIGVLMTDVSMIVRGTIDEEEVVVVTTIKNLAGMIATTGGTVAVAAVGAGTQLGEMTGRLRAATVTIVPVIIEAIVTKVPLTKMESTVEAIEPLTMQVTKKDSRGRSRAKHQQK